MIYITCKHTLSVFILLWGVQVLGGDGETNWVWGGGKVPRGGLAGKEIWGPGSESHHWGLNE